ncbi:MAG TPA: hypothetical protein VF916_08055 [Ktedonobacterales bacterium]
MAETPIQEEHKPALARAQHVLEWLQGERARLEAEFAQILAQGQREQAKLVAFLGEHYGVDLAVGFTLDTERGVIVTPDAAAAEAAPEPAPETPFLGGEP